MFHEAFRGGEISLDAFEQGMEAVTTRAIVVGSVNVILTVAMMGLAGPILGEGASLFSMTLYSGAGSALTTMSSMRAESYFTSQTTFSDPYAQAMWMEQGYHTPEEIDRAGLISFGIGFALGALTGWLTRGPKQEAMRGLAVASAEGEPLAKLPGVQTKVVKPGVVEVSIEGQPGIVRVTTEGYEVLAPAGKGGRTTTVMEGVWQELDLGAGTLKGGGGEVPGGGLRDFMGVQPPGGQPYVVGVTKEGWLVYAPRTSTPLTAGAWGEMGGGGIPFGGGGVPFGDGAAWGSGPRSIPMLKAGDVKHVLGPDDLLKPNFEGGASSISVTDATSTSPMLSHPLMLPGAQGSGLPLYLGGQTPFTGGVGGMSPFLPQVQTGGNLTGYPFGGGSQLLLPPGQTDATGLPPLQQFLPPYLQPVRQTAEGIDEVFHGLEKEILPDLPAGYYWTREDSQWVVMREMWARAVPLEVIAYGPDQFGYLSILVKSESRVVGSRIMSRAVGNTYQGPTGYGKPLGVFKDPLTGKTMDRSHVIDASNSPEKTGGRLSVTDPKNLTPEPPWWNRYIRNPLVERIRRAGHDYDVFGYYPSPPKFSPDGTEIAEHVWFVETYLSGVPIRAWKIPFNDPGIGPRGLAALPQFECPLSEIPFTQVR